MKFAILALLVGVALADVDITEKRHAMYGAVYGAYPHAGYPGVWGTGMYGPGFLYRKRRSTHGDVPSDTPFSPNTDVPITEKRHVMMGSPALGYGGMGYAGMGGMGYGGYPAYGAYGNGMYGAGMGGYGQGLYGMMKKRDLDGVTRDVPSDRERRDIVIEDVVDTQYGRERRDVPQGPHSEYPTPVVEYPTETERNTEKRHLGLGLFPASAGYGYGMGYGTGYGYGRMGYAGYPGVGYAGYAGYPGAMLMKKRDVYSVSGDYPVDRQRRDVPQGPHSEYSTPVVDSETERNVHRERREVPQGPQGEYPTPIVDYPTETERNVEKRHLGLFPGAGYGYAGMGYGTGYGYGRMGYAGYPAVGYAGYPGAVLLKKRDVDGVTGDYQSDREKRDVDDVTRERREVPQGPHGEYPTSVVEYPTETERNVEKRHLGVFPGVAYPGYGMGYGRFGYAGMYPYGGYPGAVLLRKRRSVHQNPIVESPNTHNQVETERNINTQKRHLMFGAAPLGYGYGMGYGHPAILLAGRQLPLTAVPLVAGPGVVF